MLCLTIVDQIIKMIISNSFMKYEFEIIPHWLRFNPGQNINLSWLGNFVDIFSNSFIMVVFNILAIFIFLSGYLLYREKTKQTKISVRIIMSFGLAGCFCSLIDKLFWGGSLDYLQIPTLFIFDIKDCYLTISGIIFVVVGSINSKEISVNEYLCFCGNKFRL